MIKQNIRSFGNLYLDSSLENGPGTIVAKDFCKELTIESCKQAGTYIRATEDNPFAYRERQLVSLLAPAMSKFTDAFLAESPISRHWSALSKEDFDDSHGWVDYWCSYRNISFLLELKHGYVNINTAKMRIRFLNDWQGALEQLKVIRSEAKNESAYNRGAILVAMQILTIYQGGKNIKPVNVDDLQAIQPACIEQMKEHFGSKAPNLSCLWQIHPNLVFEEEYTNCTEIYPGVLFLYYVSKLF